MRITYNSVNNLRIITNFYPDTPRNMERDILDICAQVLFDHINTCIKVNNNEEIEIDYIPLLDDCIVKLVNSQTGYTEKVFNFVGDMFTTDDRIKDPDFYKYCKNAFFLKEVLSKMAELDSIMEEVRQTGKARTIHLSDGNLLIILAKKMRGHYYNEAILYDKKEEVAYKIIGPTLLRRINAKGEDLNSVCPYVVGKWGELYRLYYEKAIA
mgnify:FL=1